MTRGSSDGKRLPHVIGFICLGLTAACFLACIVIWFISIWVIPNDPRLLQTVGPLAVLAMSSGFTALPLLIA